MYNLEVRKIFREKKTSGNHKEKSQEEHVQLVLKITVNHLNFDGHLKYVNGRSC
jgi:hypothetical protein